MIITVFIILPTLFIFLGDIFGNVTTFGLIGLSFFIALSTVRFFSVSKKDTKRGFNIRHSKLAGYFSIVVFILFWIIGISTLLGDRLNKDIANTIGIFIILPLLATTFVGAPILLIVYAIKSLKEGKSHTKSGMEVKGSRARILAVGYFITGIVWLFMILSFAQAAFCGNCTQNSVLTKLWIEFLELY